MDPTIQDYRRLRAAYASLENDNIFLNNKVSRLEDKVNQLNSENIMLKHMYDPMYYELKK